MNKDLQSYDVVILKTYSGDEYILKNKTIEQYLYHKKKLKQAGENSIFLKEYNLDLSFNSIEKAYGKKRYLALPESSNTSNNKLSKEQKAAIKQKLKEIENKTFEGRRKRFFYERQNLLKQLAKREEYFGLETTLSKLQKLEEYIKKDLKNIKV